MGWIKSFSFFNLHILSLSLSFTNRGAEPSHSKGQSRMPYEFACWVSRSPSGTMWLFQLCTRMCIYSRQQINASKHLETAPQAPADLCLSVIAGCYTEEYFHYLCVRWFFLGAKYTFWPLRMIELLLACLHCGDCIILVISYQWPRNLWPLSLHPHNCCWLAIFLLPLSVH